MRPILTVLKCIVFHAKTLYLFLASDIKSVMIPVSVFAHFASPVSEPKRNPLVLFWIAIHLTMFGACNQRNSRSEDERNKPWRPIPSGRISEEEARRLSFVLYAVCVIVSVLLGVTTASITLCCLTACYNHLGLNKHWLTKSMLNAGGYACFELGATQLAAGVGIGRVGYTALCCSALIIFTTVHVQDFEDEEGDRAIGRKTMALRWGHNTARGSVAFFVLMWSALPLIFTSLPLHFTIPFLLLGGTVGGRTYCSRSQKADYLTYHIYNIWLALAHFAMLASR